MKVVDAKKPLIFKITKAHHKAAKCKDPSQCVVAQAIQDTLGEHFDRIEIGTNITKVFTPTKVIRYSTPSVLSRQIPVFDETGRWDLPFDQEYRLAPVHASHRLDRPSRWDKKVERPPGAKKPADRFRGRKLPTRKVSRARD
jgi:hypothetical protein